MGVILDVFLSYEIVSFYGKSGCTETGLNVGNNF